MSDEEKQPRDEESATDLTANSEDDSGELPQIVPPKTKAPLQFNQQNNFYQQIPSSAWDRLSPDQVVALSNRVLDHAIQVDQRNYDFAMERVRIDERRGVKNLFVGAVVTIVGFSIAGYLSATGHEAAALSITLPLATILAILVGNKLLN